MRLFASLLLVSAAFCAFPARAQDAGLSRLLAEAEASFEIRSWRSAAESFKLALAMARQARQEKIIDEILPDLVDAQYALYDFKGAFEFQREILDRALERDAPLVTAAAAVKTAVIAARLRLFKEAEKQLAYAEVLFTEAKLDTELGQVYFYKAIVAQGKRAFQQTIADYQRSREFYQRAGNAKEAAARLLDIGNVYKEYLNKFDEALKHYDMAVAEFEASNHDEQALGVRIDKGNTLVELGQIPASLDLLKKTQGRINREKQPRSWIRASQMLAKALYRSGDYDTSTKLVGTILATLTLVDDPAARTTLEIDALNLRGMIQAELGRFEVALKDFDLAIAKAKTYDLKAKQAFLHNNVGYWFREMGRTQEAIAEHEKALVIDRELVSPDGIAFDLRNLGLARLDAGDLEDASSLLGEALVMAQEIGGTYNIAYSHLGLGEVKLRQGEWASASTHFLHAIDLAEASQLTGFAWQAHAGFARAAYQQSDNDLATQHFRKALEIVESMEKLLNSDEARKDFKESARVQRVYTDFESLLRRTNRTQEADAVKKRSRTQRLAPSI